MLTGDMRMVVIGGAKRAARLAVGDEPATFHTLAYARAVAYAHIAACAAYHEGIDPDAFVVTTRFGELPGAPNAQVGPVPFHIAIRDYEPGEDAT